MQLIEHDIHIWSANLDLTPIQEQTAFSLLSPDERQRANRFLQAIHRRRFIGGRSMLRRIISLYVDDLADKIAFDYGIQHKPILKEPRYAAIQFNLAHSDDLAIYAFTLHHAIGVDIERVQDTYNPRLPERFFSPEENAQLAAFPPVEQCSAFFNLWTRKEALLKATGKGLSIPLSSFSVSADDVHETIHLSGQDWTLLPIKIHPLFRSAVASNQTIKKLSFWTLSEHGPVLDKSINI